MCLGLFIAPKKSKSTIFLYYEKSKTNFDLTIVFLQEVAVALIPNLWNNGCQPGPPAPLSEQAESFSEHNIYSTTHNFIIRNKDSTLAITLLNQGVKKEIFRPPEIWSCHAGTITILWRIQAKFSYNLKPDVDGSK